MSRFPQNFDNPYAATSLPAAQVAANVQAETRLPGFCKGVFITDLIFCLIRLPLAVLSIIGYFAMMMENPGDPLIATVLWEIATGVGIVLFGVPGNVLLLAHKSSGVYFACLTAIFTVGSIGVGIWELVLTMRPLPADMQLGMMIGGTITVTIRLGIVALVGVALVRFANWKREQDPQMLAV